jgi:hypothetical protein
MSNDNHGYISLHRKVMKNFLFREKRVFSKFEAWIYILMNANHTDAQILLGNQLIDVKKGSFITSEIKLMEEFLWSKSKLRTFLSLLESQSMIEKVSDTKKTTLTVVKYSDYQDLQTTKKPQKDRQQTTKELRKDTNNNENNDNNANNDNNIELNNSMNIVEKSKIFLKPTLLEVSEYCIERKNNINPNHFIDYYQSNGWMVGKNKMKDWKATVRTWEKNNFNSNKNGKSTIELDNEQLTTRERAERIVANRRKLFGDIQQPNDEEISFVDVSNQRISD